MTFFTWGFKGHHLHVCREEPEAIVECLTWSECSDRGVGVATNAGLHGSRYQKTALEFCHLTRQKYKERESHIFQYYFEFTVEPPNSGHRLLVHCREVVPISEVTECTLQSVGGKQFVRSTEIVRFSVSIDGGSTVHVYASTANNL